MQTANEKMDGVPEAIVIGERKERQLDVIPVEGRKRAL